MFVKLRSILVAGVLAVVCTASVMAGEAGQGPRPGQGQRQPQGPMPPGPPPGMQGSPEGAPNPGQIQRWFEAFTVLQAQEALQLSEAQYGRFVTRLKALQDARRRHQLARNQIMGDLRRLTNPQNGSNDEASLTDRLKTLRDEDERSAAELKKAYEGVDEALDIRQQARFRIFEERMEQQKLELLMKTRQNARAGRGRGQS
jgi:hypothetical protein